MKKLLAILGLCAGFCLPMGLIACDKTEAPSVSTSAPAEETPAKKEITGVSFASVEYTYDGTEKSLTATGLPTGVSASYTGNKGTDAGTYNATVVLSGEGYITKTLNATLTINKATLAGISLEQDGSIKYDGKKHLPTVSGTLPTDAVQSWYFNDTKVEGGVRDADEYAVRLLITAKNYLDLELTATYTIKPDYTGMAKRVIDAFGVKPDPWSYLPQSFAIENKVVSGAIVGKATEKVDPYADFVSVSAIPTNYIGKQMNVVYGVLNTATTALGYVSTVHSALNVIETAYQTFLNNSPDDYAIFEGNAGAFAYKIELDDGYYTLTASISGVEVYIYGDIDEETYGARVQIAADNVLKYEVAPTSLTIAWTVLNVHATQIIFMENESGIVEGHIYEYTKLLGNSSTYLKVDENYTTVVGTKGDFIPTADGRNCEVYDNTTGKLVGTEVKETTKVPLLGTFTYDTLWYNLRDVQGITSIKKIDGKESGVNPDTIYINGSTEKLHSKNVSITNASRRFDIEFKEVCAYTYNTAKEQYEQITFEVPMVFIQETAIETFEEDFADENKLNNEKDANITVHLTVQEGDKTAVNNGYHVLVKVYDTIKELITQDMITAFCAKKA